MIDNWASKVEELVALAINRKYCISAEYFIM